MPRIRRITQCCGFCCCFSKTVETEKVECPTHAKDVSSEVCVTSNFAIEIHSKSESRAWQCHQPIGKKVRTLVKRCANEGSDWKKISVDQQFFMLYNGKGYAAVNEAKDVIICKGEEITPNDTEDVNNKQNVFPLKDPDADNRIFYRWEHTKADKSKVEYLRHLKTGLIAVIHPCSIDGENDQVVLSSSYEQPPSNQKFVLENRS